MLNDELKKNFPFGQFTMETSGRHMLSMHEDTSLVQLSRFCLHKCQSVVNEKFSYFFLGVNRLIYGTVIGKIKPKLYFPVGLCYVSTGSF